MFDRAQGPDEVLPRLRSLVSTAQYDRADLTPPEQAKAINLLVAIMESGKERPFEREVGETEPIDNWAEVLWDMATFVEECLATADALSKSVAQQHGNQVLDLAEYLFEYALGNMGTNPRNGPVALDDDGIDPYAEVSKTLRCQLFRVPTGIVRELRHDLGAQDPETLSRAWDLCRKLLERETSTPPAREFGFHVRHLYDWDAEWMRDMAGHVFPDAAADRDRFLAAVGSFLSKDPTEAMFFDPVFHGLYRRALDLTEKDVYDRLLPDPAFSVGRIFAHAHFRFERFGPDHPLFREFQERCTHQQLVGFVHYADKHIRLERPAGQDFDAPRVIAFWEWLLERPDTGILPMLGDWICSRSGIFTPGKLADLTLRTLTLTDGRLDDEAGLQQSLKRLVGADPEKTLRILELFFSRENMDSEPFRKVLYLANPTPWTGAIETLSETPRTREGAQKLTGFLEELHRESVREHPREAERVGGGGGQ